MTSRVTVNGVTYTGNRSVAVGNGRVVIDGKDVTPDAKQISIAVHGNVERLQVDSCEKISVTGDVGSVSTQTGDVDVGGNISGSVQTQTGDVDCAGSIGGKDSTQTGDIKHRR